jgi:hypothetical protein
MQQDSCYLSYYLTGSIVLCILWVSVRTCRPVGFSIMELRMPSCHCEQFLAHSMKPPLPTNGGPWPKWLVVLSLHYFSTLSWCLIILPKCCCTCHDMFLGIQKWSIFHESHTSYWLIKYLNPKLISQDIINTCWTYIRWSQKTIDNRKVVTRINDQKSKINETKRYMWRIVTFHSCVFWLSRVYANQWDAWYIHI